MVGAGPPDGVPEVVPPTPPPPPRYSVSRLRVMLPDRLTDGRQFDKACGTNSSVARNFDRSDKIVGLL